MEKTGAAQGTRSEQESAVILNPTQVGLAVGVVGVFCLMAFGGGVIAGMWYKASEQSTPYAALTTLAENSTSVLQKAEEPTADPPIIFYDTLKGKNKYAPLNAAPGHTGTTKTPPLAAPGVAPATSAKTAVASVPGDSPVEIPKTSLPAVAADHSGSARTVVVAQQSAPGAAEQTKSTPAAAPVSAASSAVRPAVAPATAKATAVKPVVALAPTPNSSSALKPAAASSGTKSPVVSAKDSSSAMAGRTAAATAGGKENRSDTGGNARRQAEVQAAPSNAAARSGDGQYSVQAGSFRSPEQAERLRSQLAQKGYQARVQLFTTPNNESWYRVRVGNYNDRSAAGQTAQNLTSREQIQTVVANDQR